MAAEGADTLTSLEPWDIASRHVLTTRGILNNLSTIRCCKVRRGGKEKEGKTYLFALFFVHARLDFVGLLQSIVKIFLRRSHRGGLHFGLCGQKFIRTTYLAERVSFFQIIISFTKQQGSFWGPGAQNRP